MIVVASASDESVGDWLHMSSSLSDETAQLVAFVDIAVVVYLITLGIRLKTRQRMQELKVGALLENVGGGFAGVIRMMVIMAWVTVVLSLSTSGFLADQVGMNSRFGSLVLDQLPALRAVMNHGGLLPKAKQPPEPPHEESARPIRNIQKRLLNKLCPV